jgi:RNA polymerase sigma factor (sigma-70 family)
MSRLRGAYTGAVFHQLTRLFGQGTSVGATEGELLERFVKRQDEAAFQALVARHGPMVLGVCRRLLRDPNDVDDAFQATFLVLVRKAGTLRRCELLGNWLYGVAYRAAVRARSLAARRMSRVVSMHGLVDVTASPRSRLEASRFQNAPIEPESSPWLLHEISHLPERYRVPILLCYFEGLTHDEAAARLGCPVGTVKGRLSRARDLLRRRLSHRGVALSATALISQLNVSDAKGAVPAFLQLATVNAARALACPSGPSLFTIPAVAIPVTTLVEGVLQAMMIQQVKSIVLSLVFLVGTVATGMVVAATQFSSSRGDAGLPSQAPSAEAGQPQKRETSKASGDFYKATKRASQGKSKSMSPEIGQQSQAAEQSFDNLLSKLRDPGIDDIERLSQWSALTLQAELVLASSEADRKVAYQAHRNRMKKLDDLIRKLPGSAENQPLRTASSRQKVEEAEQLIKGAAPAMKGSMEMMKMMSGAMPSMPMMKSMGRMGMGGMMGKRSASGPGAAMRKATIRGKSRSSETASGSGDHSGDTAGAGGKGTGTPGGMGGGADAMGGGMGGMGGGAAMLPGMMGGGMSGGMGGAMGGVGGGAILLPKHRIRNMIAEASAELAIRDQNPRSRAILKMLEQPIAMSFAEPTPLDDILKYVKQATTTEKAAGIPIYVDRKAIDESEVNLQSPIAIDLEGVPLKTTLRLMLKQLGLAYCVRDGVLIVSTEEGIAEELEQAQLELEKQDMEESRTQERGRQ